MKRDRTTADLPTCGGDARQGRGGSPWPPDYVPPEPRPAVPSLFTACEVALVAAILAALAIFIWAWSA